MIPAGQKRTKIRAPRKISVLGGANSADSQVDYEASWGLLANAIAQIQHKNVSNLSYEQLYRKAYTLVLKKFGERLYNDVASAIGVHLRERQRELVKITEARTFKMTWKEDFLKAAVAEWAEHLQSMKFISDVLMYLNRVYVKECRKLLVYDMGVVLFDMNVIRHNNFYVCKTLVVIVIDEITKARRGQVITTRSYLQQILAMFEMLTNDEPNVAASVPGAPVGDSIYSEHFEIAFLEQSRQFYSALADEIMSSMSGTRYLADTLKFMNDEEKRIAYLLPQKTSVKVVHMMNNIMIKERLDKMVLLPAAQQGLMFWLDPLVSRVKDSVSSKGTSSSASHLPQSLNELRTFYILVERVDPDKKLLKVRLKEALIKTGLQFVEFITKHLEQQQQQQQQQSAAPPKKVSVSTSSATFATLWIDMILEFNNELAVAIKTCFNGDADIAHTIYEAFREFINTSNQPTKRSAIAPSTNAPELLSVFMDSQIKQLVKSSGAKRVTSDQNASVDETQDFLHKAISFLRFIKDKDAFEAHYANHFAKRFLNSKGSSSIVSGVDARYNGDIEELVIAKLGEELGSATMEKIIKMKKDVKSSGDLTMEWKNHVGSHKLSTIELELKVCHVSDWPKSMTRDYKSFATTNGQIGFIWPNQVRETIRTFEEYWLTGKKNDNKSLFWCPKFGSMDLRITYPSRTYDINLSTYAGVIMLLFGPQSSDPDETPVSAFDQKRELTYEEILELTNIPEADLKRQLQSIAVAPRSRLLVKVPMSKEIQSGDRFSLNSKFKSPTTKVKVLTVSSGSAKSEKKTEKAEESEEVKANIEEGRKHLVNAAVVRIMKSRQTITHNELVAELVKQLHGRFQPSTVLIKQRIEDLIEKEYLKRDNDQMGVYHYIA
ncbi:hypothetical protein FT662_04832 [Candidozyma haemuli var. vulneris]|uniref:Cullin family profile domain-containing protein n=1 Tax=Candidozyma haemuli TaxID=45357 RepID=A0A2V1B102_9ASCO|nr:hypothetical protein CXQ85_003889 [[Candida] haemuloni]KAF3985984.1 hypothetical protein FT662_04832 [[Candida] haemuloni var. vulneris]PVH23599.1 hypothetical protein CXQ85_003889 [[Candida] haemuloni]